MQGGVSEALKGERLMWNHRVVREVYRPDTIHEEVGYTIRETYYEDDGKPSTITRDPIAAYGESLEVLKWELQKMLEACDKAILDEKTLTEVKK
jgi:hypothetical protein